MPLLLQVKMSAGDEITITDITHPNKLKVRLQLFIDGELNWTPVSKVSWLVFTLRDIGVV